MDVVFCKTTVQEMRKRFPDAKYFGEEQILTVSEKGSILGGEYNEFFAYVDPDGFISGLYISFISVHADELQKNLELLAEDLGLDNHYKDSVGNVVKWHGQDRPDDLTIILQLSGTYQFSRFSSFKTNPTWKSIGVMLRGRGPAQRGDIEVPRTQEIKD